jgi:hypothetical protein
MEEKDCFGERKRGSAWFLLGYVFICKFERKNFFIWKQFMCCFGLERNEKNAQADKY